jgi:hypothetical protein
MLKKKLELIRKATKEELVELKQSIGTEFECSTLEYPQEHVNEQIFDLLSLEITRREIELMPEKEREEHKRKYPCAGCACLKSDNRNGCQTCEIFLNR